MFDGNAHRRMHPLGSTLLLDGSVLPFHWLICRYTVSTVTCTILIKHKRLFLSKLEEKYSGTVITIIIYCSHYVSSSYWRVAYS